MYSASMVHAVAVLVFGSDLGSGRPSLHADMIAAIFPVVAREAVGHKAFAIRLVRFHRQATITGTVSRTRTKHFSALHVAPEQLGDLRD